MSLNSLTCVGVHLSASPKPFTFAALDEEQRIAGVVTADDIISLLRRR
ncbi:MAG TPA: hypothetical protein PLV53_08555 [Anaerolineaceae bacterium]|nr:hypothetical protein [Anaerolineaceae bacterium]